MRIFIAHLFHESNTFAPGVTDEARFATGAYCRGEAVREKYAGTRHYIGGMLDAAAEAGAETVFSISAGTAGPIITKGCLAYYVGEILGDLRDELPHIDGICLALHGAGVAEDTPDIESTLLRQIRALTGPDIPITVSLDLHANLTSEMLSLAQAYVSLKTYPHIDTWEAGNLAMKCLLNILKTGKKPVMTACRIPILAPTVNMCTDQPGPGKEIRDYILRRKEETGVMDISFLHGFCYADVPTAGMSALVVSEREEQALCCDIANFAWSRRERMIPAPSPVNEAMDTAVSLLRPGRLVVVAEGSDHGGAGGPNDGTFLLRELLSRNLPNSIFVSIWDPETALACHRLGVGGRFSGKLGGKAGDLHGMPISLEDAEICGLSDGHFRYTTPMYAGQPYCVGKTARLRVCNVEVVVNSVPRQTHDDRMIAITGSDISRYDLVCLKSGIAYKAFFGALPNFTSAVFCNPPGCCSADLRGFRYTCVETPIYPLTDILAPVFRAL